MYRFVLTYNLRVTDSSKIPYKKISRAEALIYFDKCEVLIMTATKIETECLHCELGAIDGGILKAGIDSFTYYFGFFGEHLIVHVQCKAGSATSSGSGVVTSHAINLIHPKVLIMVGIAFGMNPKKQKIGDILVSELLSAYEFQRLGASADFYRGGAPKASICLGNRFSNHVWVNSYQLTPKGKLLSSKVIHGLMLSGEKLIDNLEEREKLKAQFPEAIGGEMEGTGLAASAELSKTDWIIVKGICDFADGNKGKKKNVFQAIAAKAAVGYCKSVLSEPYVFEELGVGVGPLEQPSNVELAIANENDVLFRRYSKSAESYYLVRDIDGEFTDFLPNYSLWLHGVSGSGKSSVIMRNLLNSGHKVVQIYLATGSQGDINTILWEILNKLKLHFEVISASNEILNSEQTLEAIAELILQQFDFGSHIIYLDEIPEYRDNKIFEDFCQALYAINSKINTVKPDVRSLFVLSSITSPQSHLAASQDKIKESFRFVNLDFWSAEELHLLFSLIDSALRLGFESTQIEMIKKGSNGSPRDMKRIIRDYLSTKNRPTYSLERIIKEIEQEKK